MAKIQNIEAEPVEQGLDLWQRGAFFAGPIVGIIAWLLLQTLGLECCDDRGHRNLGSLVGLRADIDPRYLDDSIWRFPAAGVLS